MIRALLYLLSTWLKGNAALQCNQLLPDLTHWRQKSDSETNMSKQSYAGPPSCWPHNQSSTTSNLLSTHPGWATLPTGLWTMTSPLLPHPGSPEGRRGCRPRRCTLNKARPCALWASWYCCCFSCWCAVSASYLILTAACLHQRGQTTRCWKKDSLIMQWCKEKGRL